MPLMTPKKKNQKRIKTLGTYRNKYNSIRKRFRKNKIFSTNIKKNNK